MWSSLDNRDVVDNIFGAFVLRIPIGSCDCYCLHQFCQLLVWAVRLGSDRGLQDEKLTVFMLE
jgi:hypothetical protein